jgi:hypothetical protein
MFDLQIDKKKKRNKEKQLQVLYKIMTILSKVTWRMPILHKPFCISFF